MEKKILPTLSATMSAVLLASLVSPAAHAASDPFVSTEFSAGYNLASNDEGKSKHDEGSCGGKKGEGACGNMSGDDKSEEGKKTSRELEPGDTYGPDGKLLPR